MVRSRYKLIRGEQIIRVQVDSADEILDSKDPAPFKGQILDDDFIDYIESLSDETSYKTPLRINIFIRSSQASMQIHQGQPQVLAQGQTQPQFYPQRQSHTQPQQPQQAQTPPQSQLQPQRQAQSHTQPQTNSAVISQALKEHFEYKIERKKGEIRKHLRTARLFLIFGLIILSICLTVAHMLPQSEDNLFALALREGIIIFGWVSMWRPLEVFIFDWYPHYDRIRYFRKIANAHVHVEYEGP